MNVSPTHRSQAAGLEDQFPRRLVRPVHHLIRAIRIRSQDRSEEVLAGNSDGVALRGPDQIVGGIERVWEWG